jgi:tetratricopeptide (TPR) repeat protein
MVRRLVDWFHSAAHGTRAAFRDVFGLLAELIRFLNPLSLVRMLAGGSRDAMSGGRVVAALTTSTLSEVVIRIVRFPIDLIRFLIRAPGQFWGFLRTRSPRQLAIGGLIVVLCAVGISWPMVKIFRERGVDKLRREQYRQFDEHCRRNDFDGARHNLEVLARISPEDPSHAARLKAFESGVAGANDAPLARLLMRRHLNAGKIDDAVREAKKYLALDPKDWETRILLALHALSRGDQPAAADYVAVGKLPWAADTSEPIPPWSALMAAKVFASLNDRERLDDLTSYVAERIVPLVRDEFFASLDPPVKLQLVEMYNLALNQLDRHPDLVKYWASVQNLCHSIANSPKATAGQLSSLGLMQEQHLAPVLGDMVRLKLITPEERTEFHREIEDRLGTIWNRVRMADSKQPYGYMGLAMHHARKGNFAEALREIDAGIAVCGSTPEMLEKKAELLRLTDPASGVKFLEEAVAKQPPSLGLFKVLAEAAMAASRPDKALEAIRKAHALAPDQPWVYRLEAEILLQMGRPAEAAAALEKVVAGTALDAPGTALFVRALGKSGAVSRARKYLLELVGGPATHAAVMLGIEELLRLEQYEAAAEVSRRLIREDPSIVPAHILLGDSLTALAGQTTAGWDRPLVDDAIRAYRAALVRNPNQPKALNNIAWLQLAAFDQPKEADQTLEPLRGSADSLPIEILETLGVVEIAAGKYESGRNRLLRAMDRSGPRPLTLAFLARAYHGLHQSDLATSFMNRAVNAPKGNPRDAELIEKIRQEINRGVK